MNYFVLINRGKPFGESGESCGTHYSLDNACPKCGTGAELVGSLRTRKLGKIRKAFFQTDDDDNLISENLHEKMLNLGIKIRDLKKVVDLNNKELPFYHLYTELSFPKAIQFKGLIVEEQCNKCLKDGYFNDMVIGNLEKGIPTKVFPIELLYDHLDLSFLDQSDIFKTWEHMGQSCMEVRYARPLLIVSEKFKSALEEEGIGNLVFDQVKMD